jgi:cytochrome c oxidase assembly protein subunit 11
MHRLGARLLPSYRRKKPFRMIHSFIGCPCVAARIIALGGPRRLSGLSIATTLAARQPIPPTTTLRTSSLFTTARFASSSSSSTSTSSRTSSSASRSHAEKVRARYASRNRSLLLYSAAVIILGVGVTYAAVPLYRLFCAATGFAGTPMTASSSSSSSGSGSHFGRERLVPVDYDEAEGGGAGRARRLRISFNADCSDALPWKFTPQQREVRVLPGETALAFYTAHNWGKEDLIGIATYNVTPNKVGCCPGFRF